MIFLSGQKACGKSTAVKVLEKEGFLVIDQGPLWKKIIKDCRPENMKGEDFFDHIKKITGDNKWDDNVLAGLILNLYYSNNCKYKDVVIAGYRSFEGLIHLKKQLENRIYPKNPIKIIYLTCCLKVALKRFNQREGSNISLEDFRKKHNGEAGKGILKIKEAADFVIDTTYTNPQQLEKRIRRIVYGKLQYPQKIITTENINFDFKKNSFEFGKLNFHEYFYELKTIDDAIKFAYQNIGDHQEIKNKINNLYCSNSTRF